MLTTQNEQTVAPKETLSTQFAGTEEVVFDVPALKEQVNSMIHEGLNDMWLLLSGEEITGYYRMGERRDGRALGLLWDGQVHMLTSKPTALETLRVLGIEML